MVGVDRPRQNIQNIFWKRREGTKGNFFCEAESLFSAKMPSLEDDDPATLEKEEGPLEVRPPTVPDPEVKKATKPRDIRDFFQKKTNGTNGIIERNKRPSDDTEDPEPLSKRPHLDNGLIKEIFAVSKKSTDDINNGDEEKENEPGIVENISNVESSQRIPYKISLTPIKPNSQQNAANSTNVCASSKLSADKDVYIVKSETSGKLEIPKIDVERDLKRRKFELVLQRVDESEHFTDALRAELARLKELKKMDGQEFEVEAILDYSWCRETSKGLYHVKWLNYDDWLTWEPLQNLESCPEALRAFYVKRLAEREAAQPWRKRFLEVPPDPRTGFERRSEVVNKICAPPCQSELEAFFMLCQKEPIKMWPENVFNASLDKLEKSRKPNEEKVKKIKEQIMLRHVRDKRKDQLQRLKDWEKEINVTSSDTALIKVENEVDLEGPPRHMTYINEYMPAPGIIIPNDPPLGCECEEGACGLKTEKTCCPSMNGQYFPYTKYSKLRVGIGTPIYECNKRCKCGPNCSNRVVQKGRTVKLCIYRTSNGCGWGVKALENIKKGSFIVEYVGEVITSEEAELRGKKYDAEGKTYLFDLDFNLGDNNLYTVDAALYGNLAHFVNHSCEPNLAIYNVWIDCLDPNLPKLCFFASKDIARGEQITFDYKQQTGPNEIPDQVEENGVNVETAAGSRTECRCGAPKCRKIIF